MKPGKAVNHKVAALYEKQKNRGQKGFGYFAPGQDRFVHHTTEAGIMKHLLRERNAQEILFHHRQPTSTDNVYSACHPFSTRGALGKVLEHQYIGVHNGVISNPDPLKTKHEGMGIEYVSVQPGATTYRRFNDSEALIWELALFLEGKLEKFDAVGNMAWILMQLDAEGNQEKLYFGRNDNPLKINRKHGKFLTLSSEGPGELAERDTLYTFDYKTLELSKRPMEFRRTQFSHTPTTPSLPPSTLTATKVHAYNNNNFNRSMALAGHEFPNGRFDSQGIWHPKDEGAANVSKTNEGEVISSYNTPLTFEQRRQIAGMVPEDNIKGYAINILKLVENNAEKAIQLLDDRRRQVAEKLVNARKNFSYRGPLYLDQDRFESGDEDVYSLEIDLHIVEQAFHILVFMKPEELMSLALEQLTDKEQG